MSYYRLELCPTEEGLQYYTSYATTNRSNENAGYLDLLNFPSLVKFGKPHVTSDRSNLCKTD